MRNDICSQSYHTPVFVLVRLNQVDSAKEKQKSEHKPEAGPQLTARVMF